MAIQTNGRIVAAGGAGTGSRFALARYMTDGTLDATFGGDGKITTTFSNGPALGVAIQTDGKIVAAGERDFFGFALARYRPNGALDPTFSGDGRVITRVGAGEEAATSVALQADGKIVAAGFTDVPHEGGDPVGPARFALARYNQNGRLDDGFSGDGKVTTKFRSGTETERSPTAFLAERPSARPRAALVRPFRSNCQILIEWGKG